MKFLVLLALVGVVSCGTVRFGDFGRDVKIEYTYEDADDDDVKVVEEHDRFGAPDSRDTVYVHAKPVGQESAFKHRFDVEDAHSVPASVPVSKTRFVTVPAPRAQTQYVQVEAVPVPASQASYETQYVQTEAFPAPRREVGTRYVQVNAVPFPAPVPQRQVDPRYVQVEAVPVPIPQRTVETRFVQFKAPKFRTQQVELDHDDFVSVQAASPVTYSRHVQPVTYSRVSHPVTYSRTSHPVTYSSSSRSVSYSNPSQVQAVASYDTRDSDSSSEK